MERGPDCKLLEQSKKGYRSLVIIMGLRIGKHQWQNVRESIVAPQDELQEILPDAIAELIMDMASKSMIQKLIKQQAMIELVAKEKDKCQSRN